MNTSTDDTSYATVPVAQTAMSVVQGQTGHVVAAGAQWPLAHRLVVLVPASLITEADLASRIFKVAHLRRINVLYLGLVSQPEDEPALRRRLSLLAACTRDNHAVKVDYQLAVGDDWLGLLNLAWRPGDLVICHGEQQVRRGWSTQKLGYLLAKKLGQPVAILEGFCQPAPVKLSTAGRSLLYWAVSLAIVSAFFWLQASLQQVAPASIQTVLVVLTVIVEFSLLLAWNRQMQ